MGIVSSKREGSIPMHVECLARWVKPLLGLAGFLVSETARCTHISLSKLGLPLVMVGSASFEERRRVPAPPLVR